MDNDITLYEVAILQFERLVDCAWAVLDSQVSITDSARLLDAWCELEPAARRCRSWVKHCRLGLSLAFEAQSRQCPRLALKALAAIIPMIGADSAAEWRRLPYQDRFSYARRILGAVAPRILDRAYSVYDAPDEHRDQVDLAWLAEESTEVARVH